MERKKISVPDLKGRKQGGKMTGRIAMVTGYDATFAQLLDAAGVDVILVGDSLGMVVQGHADTLPVTVDEMIYHCRAVQRGNRYAHVVCDMPFMSYQTSTDEALRNAGRLMKEGRAEAVKIEGGAAYADLVVRLTGIGIPVMGHLGLTPQSVHQMGGFRVQGQSDAQARQILDDAVALSDAGVYTLVLEGIPADLAARITEKVSCPTVGIGAGAACDGQVLVVYDLLGLKEDFQPKFVKRYDELGARTRAAISTYIDEVRAGTFPGPEHTFGAKKGK